jgi:secondary thiamine-phosphate synthase enzyme
MSRVKSERFSRAPVESRRIDSFASSMLAVETGGESFIDFTREVRAFVEESGIAAGIVTLFVRHTSASLTIQENADPDVLTDLTTALHRLAPQGAGWVHEMEGPDDMPAHIRTMLTATSLQIPVIDRQLALGIWQGIYLIEHRAAPHRREVVMQIVGARA